MLSALTIALSAFLTFQVQFILGRALLPAFGGTPAVWTTALLFFQVALLIGYAWAERLTHGGPRTQTRLHLGLVALGALALLWPVFQGGTPLLAPAANADASGAPAWGVGRALLLACGLPFAALAATSPLLQSWVAREAAIRGDARPVQRLYAISNLGSLLGLATYPFVFEPWLDLTQQAWLWSAAFVVFAGLLTACALRQQRLPVSVVAAPDERASSRTTPPAPGSAAHRTGEFLLWMLLPAAGSALMLSTSNAICQDVAVVPLLWVAPLAVYLITYIVPFRDPRWAPRDALALVAALGSAAALFAMLWTDALNAYGYIAVQLTLLGGLGLLLHGEVARLAPVGQRLPGYYLALSAGGALGGAFVSLAAPAWFRGFWELPITVLAAWLFVLAAWWRDRSSPLRAGGWWAAVVLGGILGTVAAALLTIGKATEARLLYIVSAAAAGMALGAGAGGLLRWMRHGVMTAVAAIVLLLLVETLTVAELARGNSRIIARERNFFGVVKVFQKGITGSFGERRELVHGWISHGVQFRDAANRRRSMAYYSASSGAAQAVKFARESHPARPLRLGAVGLGAGTVAALTRAGDTMRFYEINPAVVRLAAGEGALFTFVGDAEGKISIALGDGRQELQREHDRGALGGFDVLLLDAFSSDSVPAHLLTIEAFELYRAHAAPEGGIIAVHITNRALDLEPLMRATARHFGWEIRKIATEGDAPMPYPSDWMLLATQPGLLPAAAPGADAPPSSKRWPAPWTDRFSSLLPLLR